MALLCVKGGDPLLFAHFNNVPELQSLKSEALSVRLFYKNSIAAGECLVFKRYKHLC